MDMYEMLVRFFQEGGLFMYPIALVMGIGTAIGLERFVFLLKETRANRRDYEAILPLLKQKRLREVAELAKRSKSAVCRIVADGLARMSTTRRRQDIENAMEEQLLEVLPSIERRTGYLATFANIATLLGLLGTIIGLIAAFSAVANADPSEKAALLSSSISVAMNTTAFGLIVAIPLLLAHSMLQSKTGAIIESLEIAVVKFLNLLEERGETQGHRGAAATSAQAEEKAPRGAHAAQA
jgi:biopolymer transport protein ExbB/TolQ